MPIFPPFFIFIAKYFQDKWAKTNPKAMFLWFFLGIFIEVAINIYFVHFHELGAWGPIKYLTQNYPKFESLSTTNMFEGNYLTLSHRKSQDFPRLYFHDYDPPFVSYKNASIPLIMSTEHPILTAVDFIKKTEQAL